MSRRARRSPGVAADDLTLVAGVSRSAAGQSLPTAIGAKSEGSVHASVEEALRTAQVEVLVDYTSATAVKENVWAALDAGVHAVVGSSGLTAGDYAELDDRARAQRVGVIAAGNFSVMAAVLRRAAAMAAARAETGHTTRGSARAGRGARRRRFRESHSLGASPRLRGHHRDRVHRPGGAVSHAPRPGPDPRPVRGRHFAGDPEGPRGGRCTQRARLASLRGSLLDLSATRRPASLHELRSRASAQQTVRMWESSSRPRHARCQTRFSRRRCAA